MVEEIALPVGENSNQNTERVLKRILIVDDSEVIRQRLSSLISDTEGVELIGEAVDTQSAIRLWQSTNPDIVILDLRIPGDGGISVLRELKRQSPETVVAVLTNYPYVAYRKRCAELGANFFFDKSTEFEKVKTIF